MSTMNHSLNRRRFLTTTGMTALGVGACGAGIFSPAWAQTAVRGVMPGVFMPGPLKEIAERMAETKIELAPYVSPTDTMAKISAPGGTAKYDLMVSLTEFVKGPVLGANPGDEKALALDLDKIPNSQTLLPLFQDEIVVRDGKPYFVPVFWGYDSVLYNSEAIAEDAAQSWGILFDDKYAGKVALRDDAHQMITVAALFLGHEDPNAMTDAERMEVVDFLISKKKNFRTLWSKFGEAVNLMASGEVIAMYGWIAMRARLQKEGHPVTNNWPAEGLLVWNQSAFIPKDSPAADASHRVIDAMLSGEYGRKLTEVTNYLVTSAPAAAGFSDEEKMRYGYDVLERGLNVKPLNFPPNLDAWIEDWGRFKAA